MPMRLDIYWTEWKSLRYQKFNLTLPKVQPYVTKSSTFKIIYNINIKYTVSYLIFIFVINFYVEISSSKLRYNIYMKIFIEEKRRL
jgi:hypothetical protein